ncbi:MAG: NAD-binding protein, partial [Mucinivorans sp.]
MKIIVAGAGEVGSHLAKMLSEEYHDITVIDDSDKRLDSLASSADLITIEGDITQFDILKKAETESSDLFLAVSPDENSNILSAMIAKQLGSKKVVARIDNSDYLLPGNKEIFVNMGIDYMFYPEKVAAEEVITLLGHTSTTEYVDFSGGKLALVAFKVEAGSELANRTLLEVTRSREKLNYRTVAISRAGTTIVPRGGDF